SADAIATEDLAETLADASKGQGARIGLLPPEHVEQLCFGPPGNRLRVRIDAVQAGTDEPVPGIAGDVELLVEPLESGPVHARIGENLGQHMRRRHRPISPGLEQTE